MCPLFRKCILIQIPAIEISSIFLTLLDITLDLTNKKMGQIVRLKLDYLRLAVY